MREAFRGRVNTGWFVKQGRSTNAQAGIWDRLLVSELAGAGATRLPVPTAAERL